MSPGAAGMSQIGKRTFALPSGARHQILQSWRDVKFFLAVPGGSAVESRT
jgi:hypothetical protein